MANVTSAILVLAEINEPSNPKCRDQWSVRGLKKPDEVPTLRGERAYVTSFGPVAECTRISEIIEFGMSSVLLADNVIYL